MIGYEGRSALASPSGTDERRSTGSASRAGYWWGALLIVLGAVVGGILLAFGITSAIRSLPQFTTEFDVSSAATRVEAPAHWALFVRSNELPAGTCTAEPASGSATVSQASTTMTFERNGGHWTWVADVDGTQPGTYAVSGPAGHYAVGEQPQIASFAARIGGGVFGLIVPLFLGMGGGAAIIIATAVRRSRAGREIAA